MINFIFAISASIIVSLISLIGIFSLIIKENILHKILFGLVGFSAGALIGGAFIHILPEVLEESNNTAMVFYFVIAGIVLFFLMERYFYWRHCHEGVCDVHAFTYLNLIGDGLHNFIDGMVIAASFVVSVKLGLITTLAVIFHEIPQEMGDFGVLVHGGWSKQQALLFNFLSGLMFLLGFFTWLATAKAVANDRRLARGLPPRESVDNVTLWLMRTQDPTGAYGYQGQVAPAGTHFYIYGEAGRLARPILFIAIRDVFTEQEWADWFENISSPEPNGEWSEVFGSQAGLAKLHNTRAFVEAIYVNATASDNDALAPLRSAALDGLRRLP